MLPINDKTILLIDGSSYLFRAYYALPALVNSKNIPTGAVFGVINMLKKLLNDYDPQRIAVVFDPKGKTFRHELYQHYKANRTETPEDLSIQVPPLHELIRALGLPLIIEDHVEADDVIATLTFEAKKQGLNVVIITGDKDLAQLVDDQVVLLDTMRNRWLDSKGVKEKFGVMPEQIVDYLTLVGDTSDNIPGIPNVGPKTAAKWLGAYGSLANIIQHAEDIKGKIGENLRQHLKQLPMVQTLVRIKHDLPIKEHINDLIRKPTNAEQLTHWLQELEFHSWLKEFNANHATTIDKAVQKINYKILLTEKALDEWMDEIKKAKVIAIDTETTALDAMQAALVGISMAISGTKAVYIPIAHNYLSAPHQLKKSTVLNALKPFFNTQDKLIVGQNLKYDLKILKNEGIIVNTPLFDTMVASYLVNAYEKHDLDSLALKYLNYHTITFEQIAGKGKKQLKFNQITLAKAAPYAAEDAAITFQLYEVFNNIFKQNETLKHLFSTLDMPLMLILMEMEYNGVLIDTKKLKQQNENILSQLERLKKEIYTKANSTFNIDSPKQLQEILYDRLKLPALKKTPTGQTSTSESALQRLVEHHSLPQLILDYRSLNKLKTTYTDKLPHEVNSKTHRIHTSYHQTVTSTGRLSSSGPNLQNIPIKTSQGRKIREAFIAPQRYCIVAADYSQIELRIMAHLSKDKTLVAAFKKQLDIHKATAAEVFDVPLDNVTALQRRQAKAINFGLMYGMSGFGLARTLKISRSDAKDYIETYFKRYPDVNAYIEQIKTLAKKQGYVETLYGRKISLPNIHSKNFALKSAAERAAINAPMQGTAADIIKLAMIKVKQWIKASNFNVRLIMQVHDELVFEVEKENAAIIAQHIKTAMENAANLSVPLVVDIGIGNNWNDAH
jgi:DNA polymerase-1